MIATLDPTNSKLASLPRVGFGGVLRSEWIKLRTLRSTWWALGATVLVAIAIPGLLSVLFTQPAASAAIRVESNGAAPAVTAAGLALTGITLAQVVVCVLGVLAFTSEYASGQIRSTFAAVPRRTIVLTAKASVFFVLTLGVGLVIGFGAFLIVAPRFGGLGSLTVPGLLRLVTGAFVLAVTGAFAVGIGAILRSSAGAISATLGLLFLVPNLIALIPTQWAAQTAALMPSAVGSQLIAAIGADGVPIEGLSAWQCLVVLLAWLAASLGGAATLLARRDA